MIKVFASLGNIWEGTGKGVKDTLISLLPQATALITGFITIVLIARGLGPDGMGEYALLLSFSSFLTLISDFGISQTAVRFASRAISAGDSENQLAVLRWAFRLRMSIVLITTCIGFIVAPIIVENLWQVKDLTFQVRMSLLITFFSALASVPTLYFQSLKRFRMNAAISVGQSMISFLGILLLLWLDNWVLQRVVIVSVVASAASALIFLLMVPKAALFNKNDYLRSKRNLIRNLWNVPESKEQGLTNINSFAISILVASIIVTFTMKADVWLMGYYLDKSQVGLYSVAVYLTIPFSIILGAITTALWPRASVNLTSADTIKLLSKTFKICLFIAAGGAIYSYFAPYIIPLVFGVQYENSILIAQILNFRYVFAILTVPMVIIGYNFGLVRVQWLINLTQLFFVVILNVLLLAKIGPVASALALLVNDFIGFLLFGLILWLKISKRRISHEI